jgi:hypothetical protein
MRGGRVARGMAQDQTKVVGRSRVGVTESQKWMVDG